jgi:hypothetical protein
LLKPRLQQCSFLRIAITVVRAKADVNEEIRFLVKKENIEKEYGLSSSHLATLGNLLSTAVYNIRATFWATDRTREKLW